MLPLLGQLPYAPFRTERLALPHSAFLQLAELPAVFYTSPDNMTGRILLKIVVGCVAVVAGIVATNAVGVNQAVVTVEDNS